MVFAMGGWGFYLILGLVFFLFGRMGWRTSRLFKNSFPKHTKLSSLKSTHSSNYFFFIYFFLIVCVWVGEVLFYFFLRCPDVSFLDSITLYLIHLFSVGST